MTNNKYTPDEQTIEEWRGVYQYEDWYAVSNFGRIMRVKPGSGTHVGKILSPHVTPYGYQEVNLSTTGGGETILVHRIVARAFHGAVPPGNEVNHKNGIKIDNRSDNLEYLTRSEHMRHSIDELGLYGHNRSGGEKHVHATLSDEKVREIYRLYHSGEYSQSKLAKMYKCGQSTIGRIVRKKTRQTAFI